MRIRALVHNKVMLILVDSDSSHSFVSQSFVAHTGIQAAPAKPIQVRVANGEPLLSTTRVSELEWWAQGYTFYTDMRVLQFGSYDAILCYDWLKQHSPMVYHWDMKTMEFQEKGQHVHLQGIQQEQLSLDAISPEQFVKWYTGNDIWALAVVQSVRTSLAAEVPHVIDQVLQEF
jgi:hypothetical protein